MIPKSPLLAETAASMDDFAFPCIASPKLDGIRCLIVQIDGRKTAVSRKFKPIPNDHIRAELERVCPIGFDGEITVPNATFHDISSAVMTKIGSPRFEYHVFDFARDWSNAAMSQTFSRRLEMLNAYVKEFKPANVVVVPQTVMQSSKDLEMTEELYLKQGYEGVMLRTATGSYKQGRSTVKEKILLKLKRFAQTEATIIGYTAFEKNMNEAKRDLTGQVKRSTHKANRVAQEKLGSLICVVGKATAEDYEWAELNKDNLEAAASKSDKYFGVGSGFTDEQRVDIWKNVRVGQMITFKHQPSGAKEGGKPRFPVFIGFRHQDDI